MAQQDGTCAIRQYPIDSISVMTLKPNYESINPSARTAYMVCHKPKAEMGADSQPVIHQKGSLLFDRIQKQSIQAEILDMPDVLYLDNGLANAIKDGNRNGRSDPEQGREPSKRTKMGGFLKRQKTRKHVGIHFSQRFVSRSGFYRLSP